MPPLSTVDETIHFGVVLFQMTECLHLEAIFIPPQMFFPTILFRMLFILKY